MLGWHYPTARLFRAPSDKLMVALWVTPSAAVEELRRWENNDDNEVNDNDLTKPITRD